MELAATCLGVKVPNSPFLNESRIERLNAGRYEGQEILGVMSTVSEEDRVLELGAGIGVVGAVAAHNKRPQKVLSFEANPNLIPTIKALYQANDLENRISVINEVLVSAPDRPAEVTFHVQNSYLGSSLIPKSGRNTTEVSVKTRDFEDVRTKFKPTILVMDIEGGELDLLRHANLDGIRAVVLEFHPEAYGVDGMRECKDILRTQGFEKVDDISTRLVWTCIRSSEHIGMPPDPDGGWSHDIETVQNALVVPPSESAFTQNCGVLRADGSYCENAALWRNTRALTVRPTSAPASSEKLSGKWLWGGVWWFHFGHFLVETTNRLWGLDHTTDVEGIVFIPKRPHLGDDLAAYQVDFLKFMGIDLPVKILTGATEIEQLVVPGQAFGLGKIASGTPLFRDFVRSRFAKDIAPKGSSKLYISRSKIGLGRGALIGEEKLEEYLRLEGYDIIHPEKHDLKSQIERYKAATHVIASEGSAIHMFAMVARPEQRLAVIARRNSGATDHIERHVSSFSGNPPVSIKSLKRAWMPKGKTKKRMARGEMDMPGIQTQLEQQGFIEKQTNPWTSLDASEVEGLLQGKFEIFEEFE